MNTITSKNEIRLHFLGLQQKESQVFERVVSFNKNYGLNVEICDDISIANLVVTTEVAFSEDDKFGSKRTVLVITKDASLGDVQVASPLLITRVLKALGAAIKLVDEKSEKFGLTGFDKENESVVDPENQRATEQKSILLETATVKNSATQVTKEATETPQAGRFHALVIDDSISIRKHLELELRDAGVSADFSESGEQALEKIKERSFDLIFLDIMMPGIDGYETCKRIRENPAFKKTPVIMLSGKTSPLDEVQGIIAGASTYLTKPVKSDKLQAVLGRVTNWISDFNSNPTQKSNSEEQTKEVATST